MVIELLIIKHPLSKSLGFKIDKIPYYFKILEVGDVV